MAEVDTSSYLKPGPPQNPLDQILKTGQAADVLGQFEVGKGIQQAIQPDGSIDRNVLAQVLKGSIAGSMKAPEALTSIEKLRQQGHISDQAGVESTIAGLGLTGQIVGDLAAKGAVSKEELTNGAGKIINHLVNTLHQSPSSVIPHVADVLAKLNGDPSITPQQRAAALKQLQYQTITAKQQLEYDMQRGQWVDNGQRHVFTPIGSQRSPAIGTKVQQEIPPTAEQPGPNNQPTFRGTQPPSTGADIEMPGPRGSGLQPPRSKNLTDTVTGYQGMPSTVTSGGQPVKLAQPGDGTQYGVPRGGAAALAPGQAEPLTASGAAYAKDLAESRGFAERMNPLKQAIPLLEKLGKTGVGPTTETIQHIKSAAQSLGLPIPNEKAVTNYAEAKKYLSQNAAAVAPPGTNIPSVLNAFEANPNMQQPQQAAVELSKMLYGLGRLRQASVLAFQKTGLPAGQYTEWASKWAPQQDIRGYIADLMTPEARKELLKSVKKGSPQAAKIAESYKTAKSLDLLGDVERP